MKFLLRKTIKHESNLVHKGLALEGVSPFEVRRTIYGSKRHYNVVPLPTLVRVMEPRGKAQEAPKKNRIRFKTVPKIVFGSNGDVRIKEGGIVLIKEPFKARKLSAGRQAWRLLIRASVVALTFQPNHDYFHGFWKFLNGSFNLAIVKLRSFLRLYHRVNDH